MDSLSFAKFFLFFILASFVGWLVEECWIFLRFKKISNRGFLIGPLCPIYGAGATFVALLSEPFLDQPVLVFGLSAICCAALEYITSFLLEKIFGARWWDYSKYPFNLHGRICLPYAVLFGILGLFVAYVFYPFLMQIFATIPETLLYILCLLLGLILLADLITSAFIIKGFRKIRKKGERDNTEDIAAYVRQTLATRGRLYRRLNSFNFIFGLPRTFHYRDFGDDVVKNSGQSYALPKNYHWIRQKERPLLFALGRLWARIYRIYTGTRYVNQDILPRDEAYFIYGNHTQAVGDILAPVDYCHGRRLRLLASPANLGLPAVGPFLPDLGALPVPDNIHDLAKLESAIEHYLKKSNPIIIYPEAHVWPYYTKIRPFSHAAFTYPVKNQVATFAAVTTYQKRRFFKKPRRVIYFSGPFYPDQALSRREQIKNLRDQVLAAMEQSAKKNTQKYIKYIHKS